MNDSPVSAFAVYKSNKQSNKNKKVKKRRTVPPSAQTKDIPEEVVIQAAHKIKKQQKRSKAVKKNLKTKSLDKKKSEKNSKIAHKKSKLIDVSEEIETESDDDSIPMLVPAPALNGTDADASDVCSNGSFEFTPVQTDSVHEGFKVFKWMIAPYDPDDFLYGVWEKKPLHIARKKPTYYKDVISTPIIDDMLRKESIEFTKNIDITSYENGVRETHNPEGRAHPHLVWDYYLNGCSIRLLNPQTYIPKLHLVNATMQEFFNSFVGANAYLTPPDSQGFAPHYDDIEAFILQAEGKKHWRIYKPLNDNEVLPRVSSKNYDQEEIGEPIMEVTLEAGDMLYFPRGYIHQGVTIDGEHSLHVTVSMYQKHSWADFLEKLIPAALQEAISQDVEFRKGLPFDIYDNFGAVHSDSVVPRRKEIENHIGNLFKKIKQYLPIDDAVDQMAKNYQHDALPPVLSDLEKAVTVFGDSDVMVDNGRVINRFEIELDTRIRLLRKNILRMVSEDKIRLYYHVENSLEYHGNELSFLEIEPEFAPAIETLITTYPDYVSVEGLDLPSNIEKIQLADALWGRGLIMTEYPTESTDWD